MKTQEQLWEEQRQFIIKNLRSGKIEINNNFTLAEIDGIFLLTRVDLIPISSSLFDHALDCL